MTEHLFSAARIGLALFLVALNGFFVAAEFALVRLRSASVETLVKEGRRSAGVVKEATDNLDDYLAVSQLGITISSLGLGWVGEPAVAVVVEPILAPIVPEGLLHIITVGIGFGIVTFLHVVYGELAPKTLAIQRAEQVALLTAPLMKVFYYLFLPGIIVFNGVAIRSVRLLGVTPSSEEHSIHTEAEILSILSESGEAGRVDAEEVEMIKSVFSLDDMTVREIMRPRPDVTTIPAETALPELRKIASEGEYTRYPIVDDADDVLGFVDIKDILRASERIESNDITAGELSRDVVVVPETLRVDKLLEQFQSEQRQMAAVIDEWGAFEGLVTVEDVVEVLVGDIRDQFDLENPVPTVERRDDGSYAIDGSVPLSTVNEQLQTVFESDGVGTIGGFVLSRLGRAPEIGDTVEANAYEFQIDGIDGARITHVTITETDI